MTLSNYFALIIEKSSSGLFIEGAHRQSKWGTI